MRHLLTALRLLAALVVMGVTEYLFQTLLSAEPGTGLLLSNTFATPSWVMRKMARRLTNNCVFTGTVNISDSGGLNYFDGDLQEFYAWAYRQQTPAPLEERVARLEAWAKGMGMSE